MKLIESFDKEFPESLKKIKKSPKRIWIEGNEEIFKQKAIAVVGSRKFSNYGEKYCKIFTKNLIEYNLVIVSGMAIGIDSIAHKTAIRYGGATIAVLPSGINNIYPKENIDLYREILKSGGLIVSEYPPDEDVSKEKFLERNRIVSGLAIGTLVIEAGFRSGTSVTAKITKDEGKNVFCIPGSLDNSKSLGTNIMIKKGAKLITNVEDIINCYDFVCKEKSIKNIVRNNNISEEYKSVYEVIKDIPLDINTISKLSNKSIKDTLTIITILEIDNKIRREGNGFVLN